MGAPITIEQMITNHNIGVNLSDAETLDGHTIDDFSMKGHKHSAADITSGMLAPERLPIATSSAKGIVSLTNSTNSDSNDIAASASALKSLKTMLDDKADRVHRHHPQSMDGGKFENILVAKNDDNPQQKQIRNIYLSSSAPTNLYGEDGDIWLQYED